jgi:uncharacterized protein YfaS (alpha-2-macroglobulin family)
MTGIYAGTVVRVRALFRDFDGNPRDPPTVTLRVRRPSGSVQTITDIQHPDFGLYYADVLLDEPGMWRMEWSGSGNPTVVNAVDISVSPRPIPS